MRLPKALDPSPIKEAVVEIRFETPLPSEAVFGVVYNAIHDGYPELEKLPILQVPEAVRAADPNLMFQPHYRLKRDNYLVQIGPRVLSVNSVGRYPGWEKFLSEIEFVFSKVHDLEIVQRVTRFGIRYVDFFDLDVFKILKLRILLEEEDVQSSSMLCRIIFKRGDFQSALHLSNEATFSREGEARNGSLLDLDTYLAEGHREFFTQMRGLLEESHQVQKELFFGLLRPDFLESLHPTYE